MYLMKFQSKQQKDFSWNFFKEILQKIMGGGGEREGGRVDLPDVKTLQSYGR